MIFLGRASDDPALGVIRSDDLSTKREIYRVFRRTGSARVLAALVVALGVLRIMLGGPFGRGDAIALVATIALTGPVEWIIHLRLLHAPPDSWTSRRLGTGAAHQQHHLDPPDVDYILLRGVDAALNAAALGVITAMWSVPLMWLTGSSILGGFLTGWTLAALGLLHYEWVHLFVHTRYRPRTRYYRTLERRHRLHHFRNERYWLGVTSNTGDRLFRTLPKHKADVPLSDTARTLSRAESADR
jgi:sterol desaturase/sphingolipid hydroxylase (fatty acid hydroxylase superfamily)